MIKPEDIQTLAPDGSELEKRIDATIRNAAITSKWPATAGIRGEPISVVDQAVRRYLDAGWKIRRVDDPREGDYIEVQQP